jgi:hypothetical protein
VVRHAVGFAGGATTVDVIVAWPLKYMVATYALSDLKPSACSVRSVSTWTGSDDDGSAV